MSQASASPLVGSRTTARAFFVSERLNTSGLERGDVLATIPLAFRVNANGVAVLFRSCWLPETDMVLQREIKVTRDILYFVERGF